jgi:hypothetical protein
LELLALRFFKIDVEGMEPEVIAGALATIRRCRPIMFVEINHAALARRGHHYGEILGQILPLHYELEWIDSRHTLRADDFPQIDLILRPRETTL